MINKSKFLSLVLRHAPERIGIMLDANGWVPISNLLQKLEAAGQSLNRDELQSLVDTNNKKRFTISDDGLRIRAAQGHSIKVDLAVSASIPPKILFHGTASKNLDSIFLKGLLAGNRQQVHLSIDQDTAIRVGQRHGIPTVLIVDTVQMQRDGHQFFQADNGVWLTDHVPANYLSRNR